MSVAPSHRQLSTAAERRETLLRTAIHAFAERGYYGTPTMDIARQAGISQAYLYRLFPTKEALFVAVVERCFARIRQSLAAGAARATAATPEAILDAMGDAYARLIVDRDLLLVQLQAQSAAHVPAVGEALRLGYADLVEYVRAASGAGDAAIQRFFAMGLLCNFVVSTGAESSDASWARTLAAGLRHY
jgi:AcrR family transcriptional regulator